MTFFPLWIWRGLLQILVTSTATVSHYTIMAISFSLVMIFRKVYWNENWIRIRQDPILLHMNIILLSKKSLLFVKILFILVTKYKNLLPWITQMRVNFFLQNIVLAVHVLKWFSAENQHEKNLHKCLLFLQI